MPPSTPCVISASAAFLLALSLTAGELRAHGGQYRGPSNVVPPSSGGGSSGASGPCDLSPPPSQGGGGSAGPSTPAPTSTTGPMSPAATKGAAAGTALGPDLGRWQYWWEFNKDEVIGLRRALEAQATARDLGDTLLGATKRTDAEDRRPPTRQEVTERIRPVLIQILGREESRDVVSGTMVALAKISEGESDVREQFRRRLQSKDQEIRETAALALGIAGNPDGMEDLRDLFADREAGRTLVGRAQVDNRTRAFAGYGLGLIANASRDPNVKLRAFAALSTALAPEALVDRNIRVAAILGIRMLDLDPTDARQAVLLREAVDKLLDYYRTPLGVGEEWQQAHAPLAVSRLLGRGSGDLHQQVKGELMAEFSGARLRSDPILQSAALALGHLSLPEESWPNDAQVSQLLRKLPATARDWQVRVYALQSLGSIGGADNRKYLLQRLETGRQLERAWSAMALGFAAREADRPDPEAGALMRRTLDEVKDPEIRGALAVGLGLVGHQPAVEDLRRMMVDYRHQDELCGYLCIGLSLLGDRASLPALQKTVTESMRRPDLLKQAAVALGKLGDHRAIDLLRDVLQSPDVSVARLGAVATALSQIGDRRCIDPLLQILQDDQQIPLARAFAAVALGGIGDKSPLPWNATIGRDLNYRAAVETLTSGGTGVLDIF